MKILNLTDDQFEVVKEHVGTKYTCITDGCLCGDWEVKLEDELYLILHRSCRKSSDTPADKKWYIDSIIYLYGKQVEERWQEEYPHHNSLIGKLNRIQTKILRDIANKTTELECGHDIFGEEIGE